jgi:hypothetical protein
MNRLLPTLALAAFLTGCSGACAVGALELGFTDGCQDTRSACLVLGPETERENERD